QYIFKRISAFTVGEFCAENTRFLDEVQRLERRAKAYERLRDLATSSVPNIQEIQEAVVEAEKEQVIITTTTATTNGKTGTETETTTSDNRYSSTILYQQISKNVSTAGPIVTSNNGSTQVHNLQQHASPN